MTSAARGELALASMLSAPTSPSTRAVTAIASGTPTAGSAGMRCSTAIGPVGLPGSSDARGDLDVRAGGGAASANNGHASAATHDSRERRVSHRVTVTSKHVRPIGGKSGVVVGVGPFVNLEHVVAGLQRRRKRLDAARRRSRRAVRRLPRTRAIWPLPKCSTRSGSAAAFNGARARAVIVCTPGFVTVKRTKRRDASLFSEPVNVLL